MPVYWRFKRGGYLQGNSLFRSFNQAKQAKAISNNFFSIANCNNT